MMRTRGVAISLLGATLLALAGAIGRAAPAAQESPTATVLPTATPFYSSSLLGRAEVPSLPGESSLRVVTVILPSGLDSQPFSYSGTVLLLVQSGTLTLDAEEAQVGPPNPPDDLVQPLTPTPGPIQGVQLPKGYQAVIAPDARTQLHNRGSVPVTLLMIILEPLETPGTPIATG